MKVLEKNLMVLASAGSGKTYQLGNRMIGLAGVMGVDPEKMVALTFTRKAAGEFADSILVKLARGVLDEKEAEEIFKAVGEEIDVERLLERVVRSMPKMQLTTMDGFFSKIVRGFPFELGLSGGTFELLEGERLQTAQREILQNLLGESVQDRTDLYHAFRRIALGRAGIGVQRGLEEFLKNWHGVWKAGLNLEAFGGGVEFGQLPKVSEWEKRKTEMIEGLRDEKKSKAWAKMLDGWETHRVGTSPKLNLLGKRVLEKYGEAAPIEVKDGRSVLVLDDEWDKICRVFELAIGCELAGSVQRTKGIGEVIGIIDQEHERSLRQKGLLSFDDIKHLLGEWSQNEEARVRRELVDYRLDGRYDHWLLDEFQDTSRAEWLSLEPLIEEAVSDEEGSFFVVGDRKQGIYAWRGGEVSLFDEVKERYSRGGQLKIAPMSKSYRSCPAVLELVNQVCGDLVTIGSLFGDKVARRWEWEDHVSAHPDLSGEAKVTECDPVSSRDGEIQQEVIDEIERLRIGANSLTCGVLLRRGDDVKRYAEALRKKGFEVVEAGERSPGKEHPVGIVIDAVIGWLADPSDRFFRGILEMSPVGRIMERYGDSWPERWQRLLREIREWGFASGVSHLLADVWGGLDGFGRRRAEDLLGALANFDVTGDGCPRGAASFLHDLKIAEPPGAAAIQVMTIHKSKGLGFDVVVLPEFLDRDQVPDRRRFEVALGKDWVLQPPGLWTCEKHPVLRESLENWGEIQKYENLCLLYVALTRAKRGLYVFLPQEPRGRLAKEEFASPGNLIRQAVGKDFCAGDPCWAAELSTGELAKYPKLPKLKKARAKRARHLPSQSESDIESSQKNTRGGRRLGIEVHRLLEKIEWLEKGEIPRQEFSRAGKLVEDLLANEELHRIFERSGQERLYREQGIEVILGGRWVTGVVDRMAVFENQGSLERIEVFDFKTDDVENEIDLIEGNKMQMITYREALQKIYGVQDVKCWLVSTKFAKLFEIGDE